MATYMECEEIGSFSDIQSTFYDWIKCEKIRIKGYDRVAGTCCKASTRTTKVQKHFESSIERSIPYFPTLERIANLFGKCGKYGIGDLKVLQHMLMI